MSEATSIERLSSLWLTVTLTWDTENTDLDLHVFDPAGNHASYRDFLGIPGGSLDRDDETGYGPEAFTIQDPTPGEWRVAVDAYDIDGTSTQAALTIDIGRRTEFGGSYTFTSDDENETEGDPTSADPAAFWDAHTFLVGELEVVGIHPQVDSPNLEAIFTTHIDEGNILVEAEAPDFIPDTELGWIIRESVEDLKSPRTICAADQLPGLRHISDWRDW